MSSTTITFARPETIVPPEVKQAFLARANTMNVRRGQILISEGLDSNGVYLILTGSVQVSLISPAGKETIIRDIGEDQIFGELAAIDGSGRSTNVTALTDTRVAVISGEAFVELATHEPAIALWLTRHLTTQIRYLTSRIYELSTMAVGSRLHCELMRLCLQHGVTNDQTTVARAPTHADLAGRIGTNRESVTRELGQLSDEGIIRQTGRTLEILSVARLGNMVERLASLV
jgi:CRP/FNR family transcriptional regulator, cyclic AMP receptor protein